MVHHGNGKRTFFCIGGPSCSGKDTVRTMLLERHPDDLIFIPRFTDRPIRPEEDPRHVRCVTALEFTREISRLKAVACTNGYRYGVHEEDIDAALKSGRPLIGVVGTTAGVGLKPYFEELGLQIILLFLAVPVETLEGRLTHRGHTSKEIEQRLQEAQEQWETVFDHVIRNDGRPACETVEEVRRALVFKER